MKKRDEKNRFKLSPEFLLNNVWYALLPAFAFLLYSNTLNYGYNGDDDAVTKGNRYVQQGINGIGKILTTAYYDGFIYKERFSNDQLYRPLSLIHFAFEKEFSADNPKVGHWFNVVYYSLACLLLFLFLSNILSFAHSRE